MSRAYLVPITPAVLRWALEESGHSTADLARKAKVEPSVLNAWLKGKERPGLTQFKKLAQALNRPMATLLLPAPPKRDDARPAFRRAPGGERPLSPQEREQMREARYLQRKVSWIRRQLGRPKVKFPTASFDDRADDAAKRVRTRLKITMAEQSEWSSPGEALKGWRAAVQAQQIVVLFLPLGEGQARGLSIWDDYAPIIVVNNAWKAQARCYTIMHELGHIVTRSNSVCAAPSSKRPEHGMERWCEEFAAAVLMPETDVTEFIKSNWTGFQPTLKTAGTIARHFKVSLRASVIRLIELERATWALYRTIPKRDDFVENPGGTGRERIEIRRYRYGESIMSDVLSAKRADLIAAHTAMRYLKVSHTELTQLESEFGDDR